MTFAEVFGQLTDKEIRTTQYWVEKKLDRRVRINLLPFVEQEIIEQSLYNCLWSGRKSALTGSRWATSVLGKMGIKLIKFQEKDEGNIIDKTFVRTTYAVVIKDGKTQAIELYSKVAMYLEGFRS